MNYSVRGKKVGLNTKCIDFSGEQKSAQLGKFFFLVRKFIFSSEEKFFF